MTSQRHSEKLALALKEGEMAGLSLDAMFPKFFRVLTRMGLPMRPLHFMPALALFASVAFGLSVLFLLFYNGAVMLDLQTRLIRRITENGGQTLVVMLAAFMSAVTTLIVRYQALSKDLPDWRDL